MPIVYANIPQSIYCSRLTYLPSCLGFFYKFKELGGVEISANEHTKNFQNYYSLYCATFQSTTTS